MIPDTIYIHSIKLPALIGCLPHEKKSPQTLIIDIDIIKDLKKAAQTDDIKHTINYANIVEEIQRFVQQSHFELIETLAEHLAQLLLTKYPIESVTLKIQKPEAIANVPNIGVIISRAN
jgi:dihydroneopterin aldolase